MALVLAGLVPTGRNHNGDYGASCLSCRLKVMPSDADVRDISLNIPHRHYSNTHCTWFLQQVVLLI